MEFNNNYYYGQQVMGQQPYYGSYDPNMYGYTPMGYNNIPMPANQNALTGEEIQILRNARPASKIELSIDSNDVLRSMCTHKDNGKDVVMQVNDGSGDVYCPICSARWNPDMKSKEDVEKLVSDLVDQMENAKWTGDLPVALTRELFTLIPLLKKYPDIHEYAMNTFNKYYSARSMFNAQDASVYGMYNSLFGAGMPTGYMGAPMTGYYGQQPQPVMNTPQQGQYYPQYNPTMPTQANPMVNPMQAPAYGVNPTAPNQQFVQQANNMMGGTVYNQGQMGYYGQQAPQMPVAPVFATPQQVAQNQQTGPVVAPQQTTQNQQSAGQQQGPTITPKNDGTVESSNKINL